MLIKATRLSKPLNILNLPVDHTNNDCSTQYSKNNSYKTATKVHPTCTHLSLSKASIILLICSQVLKDCSTRINSHKCIVESRPTGYPSSCPKEENLEASFPLASVICLDVFNVSSSKAQIPSKCLPIMTKVLRQFEKQLVAVVFIHLFIWT